MLNKEEQLRGVKFRYEINKKYKTNNITEAFNKKIRGDKKTMETKNELKNVYDVIKKKLKRFSDQPDANYNIIALWIIGTYFHKNFTTYPYLYFNAMKGSGKTRVLNIIKSMSYNGKTFNNMSESSLFRIAHKGDTICIDEFESITNKDNGTMRELLNSAYKKGSVVTRMRKVKRDGEETYEPEEFSLFCPVAMANINGIDSTLGDRCISIVLDKTSESSYSLLIEDFDYCEDVVFVRDSLEVLSKDYVDKDYVGDVCSVGSVSGGYYLLLHYREVILGWNEYVNNIYNTYTIYTNTERKAESTEDCKKKVYVPNVCTKFYDALHTSSLHSRQLEISLPLLVVANVLGEDVFADTLDFLSKLSFDKAREDANCSIDASLLLFLSNYAGKVDGFLRLSDLCDGFRGWYDEEFVTNRWFGGALRRLGLLLDKRRVSSGMEVRLDWDKCDSKAKQFLATPTTSKVFSCVKCGLKCVESDFNFGSKLCSYCSSSCVGGD